ncbi:29042_t:CDS:1 [Racocetra persica]|uniref:29042_t:CDS:1 n=1 Tax=Racocetra persica TaxID=160502 RepID=A0ACA9S9R8_9GLOM|nr:29042_t:CDS:1 [Racocetra persica]
MTRTNATSACFFCKKRHQKCLRLSEGSLCTNCQKHNHECIPVPGNKRGPKPRGLRSRSANFQPYPSYGTIQNTFVNQDESTQNNPNFSYSHEQNSFSSDSALNINPFEISINQFPLFSSPSSSYIHDEETTSSFFEIQFHSHNNTITTTYNVNPYGTVDTFHNTFPFIHNEQTPNHEQTSSFINK